MWELFPVNQLIDSSCTDMKKNSHLLDRKKACVALRNEGRRGE